MERSTQQKLKKNPYVGTTFYPLGEESSRIVQDYYDNRSKEQIEWDNMVLQMQNNPFVGFFRHASEAFAPDSIQSTSSDTSTVTSTVTSISTQTSIVSCCDKSCQTDSSYFCEDFVFISFPDE